jgi:hypothetical protein
MCTHVILNIFCCFHAGGTLQSVWVCLCHEDGSKGTECKVELKKTADINDLAEAAIMKFPKTLGQMEVSDIKLYLDDKCTKPCQPWIKVEAVDAGKKGEHPLYVKAKPPSGKQTSCFVFV